MALYLLSIEYSKYNLPQAADTRSAGFGSAHAGKTVPQLKLGTQAFDVGHG